MSDRTVAPTTERLGRGRRAGWVGRGVPQAAALAALLGVLVLIAVACTDDGGSGSPSRTDRVPLAGFGEVAATVRRGQDAGTADPSVVETLCLLLASTGTQRAQGLMRVTDRSLGGHDGMLFEFPAEVSGGFWMRNTPMPLSIAFFDADGALVSTTDMAPCGDTGSCPTYAADGPYRYAVEVPKGRLGALGITDGATLDVGGECEPVAD